jgi:N-acetylglutamate synthase-like GNAT family acetyltransferase
MLPFTATHIAKPLKPMLNPKLGKECVFLNADPKESTGIQHCIKAIAGEVVNSRSVHLITFFGSGKVITLKSATALILTVACKRRKTTTMIRRAEKSDKESIQYLIKELTGHSISESDLENRLDLVVSSQIDSLFVYEMDNKVIGLLGFRIRENIEEKSRYGEISVLVVDSNYRKLGIGKKLMDFADELANKNDCMGTWLVSGFGREEQAHPFYKSLGYEVTGYRFVKLKS